MPTVLRINGYRFFFYALDRGESAHVHVAKGGGEAKLWLEPQLKPKFFHNFKEKEKREILAITEDNYHILKEKWDDFFSE